MIQSAQGSDGRTPRGARSKRSAVLLAVVLLGACGQRGDALDDFEAFPQLVAVEDLEIAGLDDDGRAFLAPDEMQLTGEVAVFLHRQERRVRIAESEAGGSLRTLVGPDDLQLPSRLGVMRSTVWIRDRLPDPMFRLFALQDGRSTERISAADWTHEGHAVHGTHLTSQRDIFAATYTPSSAIVRGDIRERILLRISGGKVEPIASIPVERSVLGFVRENEGGIYFGQPFSDDPLYALSPEGDLLAILQRRVTDSADPTAALELKHLDADSIVRRPVRYTPRSIERHWVDGIIRSLQGELGMPYSHSEPLLRDRLYQPNHLPFANDLRLDADGRAWIRVWDPTEVIQQYRLRSSPPDLATWIVIASDGEPMGRVGLPSDLRWLQAAGDFLWGAMTAADGTGIIIRYHLLPEAGDTT